MNRILLISIILLTLPEYSLASEMKCEELVQIDVNYEKETNSLAVTLRNVSEKQIEIDNDQLPWKNLYALNIAAIIDRERRYLEYNFLIDDPVFETYTLGKYDYIQGSIKLTDIFKDYVSLKNKKIIFWHHRIIEKNGTCVGESGGWLAL